MERGEAIEIVRKLYNKSLFLKKDKEAMTTLIPELKKNEDERIKKSVLKAFKIFAEKQAYVGHCLDDIDWDKCISWIEKQGKQKPAEWSEDDEKIRKALLIYLKNELKRHGNVGLDYGIITTDAITWLIKQGKQSSLDINQDYLKGIKRVQEYQDLSDWEKGFDDIASRYAYNKNQEGYNNSEYVKERAAEMLYHAKKELEKQGEQKLTPIFRIGDTIIAKDGTYIEKKPFHIDKIEEDCYWDGENTILVCNQDEFEIFKQKLADKVESKFHKGDWVVIDGEVLHVKEITENGYLTDEGGLIPFRNEKEAHIWTIQDAKDGDVLSYRDGQWIFIYKGKIDDSSFCYHTLYSTIHQDLTINDAAFTLLSDAITPATKEQRDLLFKKMKEKGYVLNEGWSPKVEQNPAWSEEDETLKTFVKDRVQPQPNQEWSEEDSKNMKECVIAVSMSEGHTLEEKERLEDWLKNHLSQKQYNYNPYKAVVESIAEMCEKYKLPTSNLSDFLDNVRVKCKDAKEYDSLYPQTTWKPSDEQIECLSDAIKHYNSLGYPASKLKELLEDLKKLREE